MGHKFKKQFGQNFLRHGRFARLLVEHLNIEQGELVIEIGPGGGIVTNELLNAGAKVLSVEIDYQLIPRLISRFQSNDNFNIVHSDIMDVDIESLLSENNVSEYKLTGSLPYNISKQIINKFVTSKKPPVKFTCIIQEEVADDYVAKPPKATFLSNWINLYSSVRKRSAIPAGQFFPKPKVNGAILEIDTFKPSPNAVEITKLIRVGFSSPRKTLWNNLYSSKLFDEYKLKEIWNELKLSDKLRPAEVELEAWIKLFSLYNN